METKSLEYTVTELNSLIKQLIDPCCLNLCVTGEVSNFKVGTNGHWYFHLKDEKSTISANVWKYNIPRMPFVPQDGQKITVFGNVNVYVAGGSYSLTANSIRLYGEGDILAKLQERKRHYEKLGYFKQEIKKPLPDNITTVGVVTSPTGAAIRDILNVSKRRNPSTNFLILPAPVQGEGAAEIIAARIEQANKYLLADVLIVGRGGGSTEDLLPFSEDCVIEAIYKSQIPVVSAVGHEIDNPLSDLVADIFAPTPSAAAELVCRNSLTSLNELNLKKSDLINKMTSRLNFTRQALTAKNIKNQQALIGSKISSAHLVLHSLEDKIYSKVNNGISDAKNKAKILTAEIKTSSPVTIMQRGFSAVTTADGKPVTDAKQINTNDEIKILFAKGKAKAIIKERQTK